MCCFLNACDTAFQTGFSADGESLRNVPVRKKRASPCCQSHVSGRILEQFHQAAPHCPCVRLLTPLSVNPERCPSAPRQHVSEAGGCRGRSPLPGSEQQRALAGLRREAQLGGASGRLQTCLVPCFLSSVPPFFLLTKKYLLW